MPNLASALKDEIRRLARKEIRAEMGSTRKAAAQHRREIAKLKRQLRVQERRIASLSAQERKVAGVEEEEDDGLTGVRFSARSVRAQRKRLKMSAEEFGKLIGVSAQTVYHWEQGKSRPRKSQFVSLVSIRGIGRREALSRLED